MKWRVVLAIAQKDIVDAVKNMYILFTLILPVGLSLVMGLMFPTEAENITLVVFDPESSQFVSNLHEIQIEGLVILPASSAEMLPAEVQEKGIGGFAIPAGFDEAVAAGQHPELTVYLNKKSSPTDLAVFVEIMRGQVWKLAGEPPVRLSFTELAAPVDDSPLRTMNLKQYLLGLYLVLGIVMAGVFVVPTLMVEEKEKHTLDALLVSPASATEVVAGKALVGLFYCLIEAVLLLGLNNGFEGNVIFTIAAVVLGSLFAVGLGLFLGSVFRTSHQVNTWASLIQLGLILPTWIGIMPLPGVLDTIVKIIPTYYMAASINLAMKGGATLASVGGYLAILAGCAALVFVAVVWAVKRSRERV